MFHRQYMHAMLMDSAVGQDGEGVPVRIIVNHKVSRIISTCKEWADRISAPTLTLNPA
jgi:hypothetical protein